MSSQKTITTQKPQQRKMHKWSRRQRQAQESWRRLSNMHEKNRNNNEDETRKNGRPERKRRRTTQASHHWWRCTAVSEENWEGKKREENGSGSSTLNKMKHGDMNRMVSGSKDLFVHSTGKNDDTKKQGSYVHYTAEKYEVNALQWKNRRNGMRARRLQMGRNSHEWNVETWTGWNMGDTSQTHFHGIWNIRRQTRSRNKVERKVEASSTPNTSRNVPSLPRSWLTDNTSNWWVCTSSTRGKRTITLSECTKRSRNTWRICNKNIPIIGGDFNTELWPGNGTDWKSVPS